MNVLGVRVDNLTKKEASDKIRDFLISPGQYKIFTPNPEMIVLAEKDKGFKNILNGGDLNLCDGFGLAKLAKINRIAGVDFMLEICKIAEETGAGVFLLGSGNENVVRKSAENLQKIFPKLSVVGFDKGPKIEIVKDNNKNLKVSEEENLGIMDKINLAKPDILFVAFGMNKQERWITENLPKLPGVKLSMGVGGAFDFISKKIGRAPCWMRNFGLEWVYRLLREPRRFPRIINATVLFVWHFYKNIVPRSKPRSN